jgi:hypothetical protein
MMQIKYEGKTPPNKGDKHVQSSKVTSYMFHKTSKVPKFHKK